MKKYKNDDIHTVAIGVSLISAALIIGPIIRVFYGYQLSFYFFDLLHGWWALAGCVAILAVGIYFTLITEKITPKSHGKK